MWSAPSPRHSQPSLMAKLAPSLRFRCSSPRRPLAQPRTSVPSRGTSLPSHAQTHVRSVPRVGTFSWTPAAASMWTPTPPMGTPTMVDVVGMMMTLMTLMQMMVPQTRMDQQARVDQQTATTATTLTTPTRHPRHHTLLMRILTRATPARRLLCKGRPRRTATTHLLQPRDCLRPPVPSWRRPATHMQAHRHPPRLPPPLALLPWATRRTLKPYMITCPHMTPSIAPLPSHRLPQLPCMHTTHPMTLRMLHHMLHTTCKRAHKRGSMTCARHCMLHHHYAPPTPPQQLHNIPPGRTAWAAASQQHAKRSVRLGSTCKRW